jgi:F-type H+-transporting ATPase subunit delta
MTTEVEGPLPDPGAERSLPKSESRGVANEPIVYGVAGRYATALFELALESKSLDAVAADLSRFEALVDGSKDLDRLVTNPVFTAEEQSKALGAVLEQAGIRGLAGKFLRTVAQKRRLFAVRDMIKAFRMLRARHRGEASAEVVVAEPLADKHLAAIQEMLAKATKKEVSLEVKVDPAILGGLVVKLGSRMVDASLKTKLNSIKLAMKEAR